MQNEALVALAIASAVDIGKADFIYLFVIYLSDLKCVYVVIKYLHKYTTCVYLTGFHSVSNLRTENSNYNQYR